MSSSEQSVDAVNDPDSYELDDGKQENGLEMCPRCGRTFSGNGGYSGAVHDKSGTRYEHVSDSDPGDGPFFDERCWNDMKDAKARANHSTLDQFGAFNGEQQ